MGFSPNLLRCGCTGALYTIFGYKGKQVRDSLHSRDFVRAFHAYLQAPQPAEVYNRGCGRESNCSMLEAIALCEQITGCRLRYSYEPEPRVDDHIWYISVGKFRRHYPAWRPEFDVPGIRRDIDDRNAADWIAARRT